MHCEGGFDPAELDRVESWSHDLVRWRRRNLYFGGTNAVEVLPDGSLAAAGDARRGGDGVVVGRASSRAESVAVLGVGVTLPFWPARSRSTCSRRTASSEISSSSTSRAHPLAAATSRRGSPASARRRSRRAPRARSEIGRVGVGNVDVALGRVGQLAEDLERPLDVVRRRGLVVVDDRLDERRLNERPRRELEEPEAVAALDDDVHAAVVEHLEHAGDAPRASRSRARRRRRSRARARTRRPSRGTRRSARGSAARRCAAGSARSGRARAAAGRGRAPAQRAAYGERRGSPARFGGRRR